MVAPAAAKSNRSTTPPPSPPSVETYPLEPGSDVRRSEGFWSLTSYFAPSSSAAHSGQQRSHAFEIPAARPLRNNNNDILRDAERALVEELHFKLLAIERAHGAWEERAAAAAVVVPPSGGRISAGGSTAAAAAAEDVVSVPGKAMARYSRSSFPSTSSRRTAPLAAGLLQSRRETASDEAEEHLLDEMAAATRAVAEAVAETGVSFQLETRGGRCCWALLLDGVAALRGEVEDEGELSTAAFYASCQEKLKVSTYFRPCWR